MRTNLLDSYDRLIAFGEKHLKDPFYLEGMQRMSLRSILMREIASNLLIHQEYSDVFPAKFVIEREILFTENGNVPQGHGLIDADSFTPYSKNPLIASVFREIGLADELGSGVRKLFKYSKSFGGSDVEMIEGEVFRLILPLSEGVYMAKYDTYEPSEKTPVETQIKNPARIIQVLSSSPHMTLAAVAATIGKSVRAVERAVAKLKKKGKLKHVGPKKGGHWEVLE